MSSSKRLETAKKFIGIFATLDTDTLATVLADSYHHVFAPSSLTMFDPLDKPGFVTHMASLRSFMTGFPVYITEFIESTTSNAVWLWCSSKTEFKQEAKDEEENWEVRGEYVFMLWMDESGSQVIKTVEMLDSAVTLELFPLMEKARANLEKSEGKVA